MKNLKQEKKRLEEEIRNLDKAKEKNLLQKESTSSNKEQNTHIRKKISLN
ncbi:MAG: hypothetical protein IPH52_27935 [Leptospiraceae bacterium]|nr:hypothetical protein [Leptospiraceae bacterium]